MADLHIGALPESFLASLGRRFLILVYEQLITDPTIITLGHIRDGKLLGFVTAGRGLKQVYVKLFRRPFRLFNALVQSDINCAKLIGIVELVAYSLRSSTQKKETISSEISSELYLLAVSPNYRRLGVATKLFEELVRSFSLSGTDAFKVLVGGELLGAQGFYESHGLVKRSHFTHHGKLTIEYIKLID